MTHHTCELVRAEIVANGANERGTAQSEQESNHDAAEQSDSPGNNYYHSLDRNGIESERNGGRGDNVEF